MTQFSRYYLFFLILCNTSLSFSGLANWEVTPFTDIEYLPRNAVNDIVEDDAGTMYFGTWGGGVWSLRGSEWRIFDPEKTIGDDCVKCLVYTEQNQLWVGTSRGWGVLEDDVWIHGALPNFEGISFKTDDKGNLVLHSNGQIYSVTLDYSENQLQTKPWASIISDGVMVDEVIDDVCFDRNGSTFLAVRGKGVYRRSGEQWILESSGARGGDIQFCHGVSDSVWAVGGDLLSKRVDGQWIRYETPFSDIRCVAEINEGECFVGTATGLWLWDRRGQWTPIPLTFDQSYHYVETLHLSRSGDVWVGCREGLYRLAMSSWTRYEPTLPSPNETPSFFTLTSPKQAACISRDGLLFLQEEGVWRKNEFLSGIKHPLAIHSNAQGDIFVVSSTVLDYWDVNERRVLRSDYPSGFAPQFSLLVDGQPVLFSSYAAYRYTSTHGFERLFDLSLETERQITSAAAMDGQTFWLGMDLGLAVWRDGQFEWLPGDHPVRDRKIRAILHDAEGSWWFGTSVAGLYRYDGREWVEYSTKNGLGNNFVSSLFQGGDGTIWVGSRNGDISSFKDERWIHYHNPMTSQLSSITRIQEDANGTVWFFSSENHVLRYSPDTNPPDTYIENISTAIAYQGIGVFSVGGFDAWNATRQDRLQYSWRIVSQRGLVQDWMPFKPHRVVSIPVLPPGDYWVEARASDMDRNMDPTPVVSHFTVSPPIWLEPQFIIPVTVLSVCVLILLWVRWRHGVRIMKSEEKYRTLVENANTIILKRRIDGTVTFWNECGFKLLGVDGSVIEHKPIQNTIFATDESVPECIARGWGEERSEYQCAFTCITPNRNAGGDKIWLAWHCHPIETKSGRVHELLKVGSDITLRKNAEDSRDSLIHDLQTSLAKIKTLQGLLPICCSCKKIRDDSGYWNLLEDYISDHSDAEFTHSFCPECAKRLYGYEEKK